MKRENHLGFQYKDGLNIFDKEFEERNTYGCAGGLTFSNAINIHRFYIHGVNLRVVELPFDDPEFKMVLNGNNWRANKIILKEKYSLGNLLTFEKFNLDINEYPMWLASENGHVDILDYHYNDMKCNKSDFDNKSIIADAVEMASKNGHLNVLNWWFNKCQELKS